MVNARMIYEILDIDPHQPDAPDAKALEVSKGQHHLSKMSVSAMPKRAPSCTMSVSRRRWKDNRACRTVGRRQNHDYQSVAAVLRSRYGGRILIDDQDISKVTKNRSATQIAYVSQTSLSVRGHSAGQHPLRQTRMPPMRKSRRLPNLPMPMISFLNRPRVTIRPLARVGLDACPAVSGSEYPLPEPLIRDASILLLDEATSALDTESEVAGPKSAGQGDERTHGAGDRSPVVDHSSRRQDHRHDERHDVAEQGNHQRARGD